MMRSHGWDRDLPQEKRTELRQKYECTEFDALYNFYVPGFNLRSTDLQAFIGIQAIDKLDNYSDIRNRNFKLYKELLINNELKLFIGEEDYISSLAMPFVNKEKYKIIELLKENNVEIRPLIAGNMAKKPMWKNGTEGIINCEIIDQHGFYLPNHQDLTQDEVRFICSICTQAIPSTNS
jgi:CDP-6-deoxy-D-xylo-4-hexulose-3-dehydrase